MSWGPAYQGKPVYKTKFLVYHSLAYLIIVIHAESKDKVPSWCIEPGKATETIVKQTFEVQPRDAICS